MVHCPSYPTSRDSLVFVYYPRDRTVTERRVSVKGFLLDSFWSRQRLNSSPLLPLDSPSYDPSSFDRSLSVGVETDL